jgi:predicted nucleic acid-binding protein
VHAFLDANVLIAAAWRPDARVQRLWTLDGVKLVTSPHAIGEVHRNLKRDDQMMRLRGLMTRVRVVAAGNAITHSDTGLLPAKDQPILRAALACDADALVTGDIKHFGPWMNGTLAGIRVLQPAKFLEFVQTRR